ncbi:hypothetical protein NUSPORA_00179 [Nucleospora cyclopteri]
MIISVVSKIPDLHLQVELQLLQTILNEEKCKIEFVERTNNMIQVKIQEKSGIYELTYFGIKTVEKSLQKGIEISISEILGYQLVFLYGFTVKDEEGVKIKPKIPIFVQHEIGLKLPYELKFIKSHFELEKTVEKEFIVDSEILNSLLANSAMYFVGENKIYKLWINKKDLLISAPNKEVNLISRTYDFLVSNHQISEFVDVIGRCHKDVNERNYVRFINSIIDKIKQNYNFKFEEIELFCEVIKKVPNGNAKIDDFIFILQKHIIDINYTVKSFKGDFTFFKQQIIPCRKPYFSLGNILNIQLNKK